MCPITITPKAIISLLLQEIAENIQDVSGKAFRLHVSEQGLRQPRTVQDQEPPLLSSS